jgi:hypothetical protein
MYRQQNEIHETKERFPPYRILLGMIALGIIVWALRAAEMDKETDQKVRQALREIFIKDIDIKGIVMDEQGRLLTAVKVNKTIFNKNGKIPTTEVINESFHVKEEDCMGIDLYFLKDGYYPQQVKLGTLTPTGVAATGKKIIHYPDYKVVMKEVGPATYLGKFSEYLQFNCSGEAKGLMVKPLGPRDYIMPSEAIKFNLNNNLAIPGIIFLRATCTDGQIDNLKEIIKLVYYGGSSAIGNGGAPKDVYLGVTGAGNGVQAYPESDMMISEKLVLRRMREAPETGYEQEILLNVREAYRYFYCKIGQFYGKGYISYIDQIKNNGMEIEKNIYLWIQPDKSRNLRMRP